MRWTHTKRARRGARHLLGSSTRTLRRARDAWSSLAFVRERARLLDVHTHRGEFETHTQPKDVFDLFEENNGISVRDILAVGSECEQSVYSLATQELVSQYFEYRQS